MKIAIIGGGMTGLTLAYELSKDKIHDITIYEREKEVGGLAAGFQIEGQYIERFYHHIFKTDKDIISLVGELGLNDKLHWYNDNTAILHKQKIYSFVGAKDLLKFSPISFISRIRTGIIALYLQNEKNWKKFENITASEWLPKYFGRQSYETIWKPILKGKFSDRYNKISMAWLWARIHTRFGSKDKGDSHTKLGYFEGGFQIIVDALLKKLNENGVKILTSQNITSLLEKENDLVIATVPNKIFAMLGGDKLPKEYVEKIFDQFVQVKGYDSEVRGTGLGLTIAKEIVEAHNGEIWCESHIDVGSSFTFTLPLKEKE